MLLKQFPFLLISLISAGTLFLHSPYVIGEELLLKQYAFIGGGLLAGLVILLRRNNYIRYDITTIAIIGFIFLLLIGKVISTQPEQCLPLLSFILLLIFFKENKISEQTISLCLISFSVLLSTYGILQFFHIINSISHFTVSGTFDNPTGFAACLSSTFPLTFSIIKYNKAIAIFCIFTIAIAIILSASRTGIVSIGITTTVYLYKQIQLKSIRIKFLFLIIPLSICLFIVLILIKKESALGRLFIWQITWNMVKDNPLGRGSGTFIAHYMQYQADFFKLHPNSDTTLLADNIFHPFNEFLFLTVDYGIITTFILIALIFIGLYHTKIKQFYALCLLSIGISSLFSYPFKYPFIWFITVFCLSQCTSKNNLYIHSYFFKLILGGIILIGSGLLEKEIKFHHNWNKAALLMSKNQTKQSLELYKKLYTINHKNNLFLYNYGAELNRTQSYKESIKVLNQCTKYWNDYYIEILLANNYINLQEWNAAENHFQKASDMCPNRFFPLYKLHIIYQQTNQEKLATEMAKTIINKKVKINSPLIHSIKNRMKKFLLSND